MLHTAIILLALYTPFAPVPEQEARDVDVELDTGERFALAFFEVVGAAQRDCSPLVLSQVRSRDLRVICATFDGGFEQLERLSREPWPDHVLLANLAPPALSFEAETEWEATGPVHQRLYRVGENVVGVRFVPGEVLVVW